MIGIHFSFERCAWDVKPLKLLQQRSFGMFFAHGTSSAFGRNLCLSRSKSSGNGDNGN